MKTMLPPHLFQILAVMKRSKAPNDLPSIWVRQQGVSDHEPLEGQYRLQARTVEIPKKATEEVSIRYTTIHEETF